MCETCLKTLQIKGFMTWLILLLERICTYKNEGRKDHDKQRTEETDLFRSNETKK